MVNILTPAEVAKILGVKESTLAQWRFLGKKPAFLKINGAVRYRTDVINALIEESTQQSTAKKSA